MKSLSLIGMSKNSGKTTVLNALLRYYSSQVLGLTSIGRDGEDRDILTHTYKPRRYVNEGTIFATAVSLLPLCDVTKEILKTTGINTPLGEVIILRARTGGYVQLAGPSINAQVVQICQTLHGYGAHTVIVDGAFSRKTPASPAVTECTILCTGAAVHQNMNRVIDQTRYVHDLLKSEKITPEIVTLTKDFPLSLVYEDGKVKGFEQAALTDALADEIIKHGVQNAQIVAEDASKFLIGLETHQRLILRKITTKVRNSTKLIALTINPVSASGYAFNAVDFKNSLEALVDSPVINVMEEVELLYDLLK